MQEFQRTEFGNYTLYDRIGAGGMAEIFLATQHAIEGFEKRLVIKRILPTLSDDQQFVRMFIEEAKLCVSLRHPNIVQVYDLGEIDQQYFIAMEYVDGRDLLKTLAACGRKKIGFPTDIALYIVMEVLKGLEYAHKLIKPDGQPLGIIHRDVSPSNVLLSFAGEVKIGDFGIAKATTREKTATGILKGKFGYMAPEQVTGAPIDHKADIFAVGIVLYELLTGHRLFAGKNDLAVLERVRDAVVDPPPRFYRQDLDPELEAIVLKALARDSRHRFESASELHDAIHAYVYRSRAMVGRPQLGRFMQGLFLTDPEELARRNRVCLPPVPISKSGSAPPPASFGYEATADERSVRGTEDVEGPSGLHDDGFDEKTPLLDPAEEAALLRGRDPSVTGQEQVEGDAPWDMPPGAGLPVERGALVAPQALEADPAELAHTVLTDVRDEIASGSPPGAVPEGLGDAAPTGAMAREALGSIGTEEPLEEVGDSAIESIELRGAGAGSARDAGAREEALALRRARENDAATELDLEERAPLRSEPRVASPPRVIEQAADSTRHGRPPSQERAAAERAATERPEVSTSEAGRRRSVVRRPLESTATAPTVAPVLEPRAAQGPTFSPAEIVERTASAITGRAFQLDLPERTERFDSGHFLAADAEAPASLPSLAAPFPLERFEVEEEDSTTHGTLEVDGADLPTSEVDSQSREYAALPEIGRELDDEPSLTDVLEEVGLSPLGAVQSTTPSPSPAERGPSPFEEEHATGLVETGRTRPARDEDPELDEDDEGSVTGPLDPNALAEARLAPSRRRPITGSKARPVLLAADPEALRRAPSRASSSRRSAPRRRVTTRVPLSVVNPTRDGSRLGRPSKLRPTARRDSTGLGALLIEEETETGAPILEPGSDPVVRTLPDRRASSGVTAALEEAAEIEEALEELRLSSTGPQEITSTGLLAKTAPDGVEVPLDDGGASLKKAVMRRQSRRRLVSHGVVLYAEDETARGERSFLPEEEASVPAITNAGRLEDEGASDLFGVLAVLDQEPAAGFAPEEELSMETESRRWDELGELLSRAPQAFPIPTPAPVQPREHSDAIDVGETRLGLLARSDTGGAQLDPGFLEDERTASVSDGQVLSIAEQPGRPRPRPVSAALEFTFGSSRGPDIGKREGSAEIDLFGEDPDEDSIAATLNEGDELEELAEVRRVAARGFVETEEPTQEQSAERPLPYGRESMLDAHAGLPEVYETSPERPSREQLVSESFDLGLAMAAENRRRKPSPPAERAPSPTPLLAALEPLERTASQSVPTPTPPPKLSASKNGGALRAVVERTRPVKELNRPRAPAPQAPLRAAGTASPHPLRAAGTGHPLRAAGTPALVIPVPNSALPSAAGWAPPAAPKSSGLTVTSWILVSIALALSAAVAVSSWMARGRTPVPIAPLAPLTPDRLGAGGLAPDGLAPAALGADGLGADGLAADGLGADGRAADGLAADGRAVDGLARQVGGAGERVAPEPGSAALEAAAASPGGADVNLEVAAPAREVRSPTRAAEPRPAPRSASPRRAAAPAESSRKKAASATGTLRLDCREPVDVQISEVGTLSDQTRLRKALEPGEYQVRLYRGGKKISQLVVKLLAGQSVDIPCP